MTRSSKPQGKLIIFSAPSGAGKTTIVRHLLSKQSGLTFSVSATCRKPRAGEKDGEDYYFLSEKEFRDKIKNDEFLEWEEVYPGALYGTLKSEIDRIRERGGNIIFDVDVVGGLNIKKYYGDEAMAVFVKPPSFEELRKRLKKRSTESNEKLKIRIAKAEQELGYADRFDVVLVNEELQRTLYEAENLVRKFLDKSSN